jgi:hypothetical protein
MPSDKCSQKNGWKILTEFRLTGQTDGDFSAWPPVEAALQPFNLPTVEQKQLELALAEAVIHAYVCEAQFLWIRLFVSEQVLSRPSAAAAAPRSWGFFLIHTQTPEQSDSPGEPGYQIELFIYRENERVEPDGGA